MDALLVSGDYGGRPRLDDAIEKLSDLALDLRKFVLQIPGALLALAQEGVPPVSEQFDAHCKELWRRLHVFQQRLELPFDHLAADRLAISLAAAPVTEVIGMALAGPACGPAGGERSLAAAAEHSAAQREFRIDVLARRSLRLAVQALVNALEGFDADKGLVMPHTPGDSPFRGFDEPRIDGAPQDFGDLFVAHVAIPIARELGMRFKEALHFGLNLEAARGVAFKRCLHDRSNRLVADEDFSVALGLAVNVAAWRRENGIAALKARLHLLQGLAAILFALQLALRRDHGLNELPFRRLLEPEVEALDLGVMRGERLPKFQVKHRIASETLQIVKDNNVIVLRIVLQVFKHRHHAGPVHEIPVARHVVCVDRIDLIALRDGIGAAAMLLAIEARANVPLLGMADAAIEDGSSCFRIKHLHYPSPLVALRLPQIPFSLK